jgi:hypothetical protein
MDVSHFKRFLHKIEGFKFVSSDFLELTWEILDLDNKRDTIFFYLENRNYALNVVWMSYGTRIIVDEYNY